MKKLLSFLKRLDDEFVRAITKNKKTIKVIYFLIFSFMFLAVTVSTFTKFHFLGFVLFFAEAIVALMWLRLMFIQRHVFLVEKGPKGHAHMMNGKIAIIEAKVDPVGVATVIAPKEFAARWKKIDTHGPRADWIECEGPARFLSAQEYMILINSMENTDKPQN